MESVSMASEEGIDGCPRVYETCTRRMTQKGEQELGGCEVGVTIETK
jgi:hypothetical protein